MKRPISVFLPGFLLLAANVAFPASVQNASYLSTVDALEAPGIEVTTKGGPACVYLDWWQDDNPNNKVRVFLTGVGNNWSGNMPVNHAGTARFVVYAEDADGNATPSDEKSYTITENTTDAKGLTNQRYPNIYNWATTTGNLDDDWYGQNVVHETLSIPQKISLLATTTTINPTPTGTTAGGFVRTRVRVSDGVGSVWFKARMGETNTIEGTLVLDRITYTLKNGRPIYNYKEVAFVTVPTATAYNQWYQFHLILQDYPEGYPASEDDTAIYRIRNKTLVETDAEKNNARIDVCDIVLTPLVPDVAVIKDTQDMYPGFPSMQDPVVFHVSVSNLYAGAQAQYVTPRLVWRQKSGLSWDPWTETVMTNLDGRAAQGDGVYACVLSADAPTNSNRRIKAGEFEYFYEASYAGYTPTFKAFKNSGPLLNDVQNGKLGWNEYPFAIHSEAWGLYTDAAGNVTECRAPAVRPDLWTRYAGKPGAVYAQSFDVVDGSAADIDPDVATWGFTHKFDIRNLDDGWPRAEAYMAAPIATGGVDFPEVAIEVPGTYDYYKPLAEDGIRRFRSQFTKVAAVTRDHPEAKKPSYLEPAYPMTLVGDYTWQAIIHQTNVVDAYFSVTGAYHSVEGMADYDAGPFEFLQTNQPPTMINPPMNGLEKENTELYCFQTFPTVEWTWVEEDYEVEVTNLVGGTMRAVGIVTNDEFYAQQPPPEPSDSDVVYWFLRLDEGTEGTVLDENWSGDETNGFTRLDYPDYRTWIERPDRVTVTNDAVLVYTNASVTAETRTRRYQVPRTVYKPVLPDYLEEDKVRTRVQIDYNGFLMYRFCTTNGSFQIRRAAWQDYNDWAADANYFSRSYGLFGMTVFESGVDSRANTDIRPMTTRTFDRSEVRREPEHGTDPNTSTRYSDGLAAKNAWFEQDAAWTSINSNWATNNMAVRLSTIPSAPGSIETTADSKSPDGGRGSLTFRVRASARDTIAQVYDADNSLAWSDYVVYAHVTVSSFSDAEDAGVSVYAYWQDEDNWIEAKLSPRVRYESKNLGPGKYTDLDLSKARRDYIALTLRACKDGTVTESAFTTTYDNNNNSGTTYSLKNPNGWVVALKVQSGTAQAWLYPAGSNFEGTGSSGISPVGTTQNKNKQNGSLTVAVPAGLSAGTIAFNASDAAAVFRPWAVPAEDWPLVSGNKIYPFKSGASALGTVCNSSADSWTVATDRYWGYANPWKAFVPGGSAASYPVKIERGVPTAYYQVQVYRSGEETTTAQISPAPQDGRDWDGDWDVIGDGSADDIKTVDKFEWQNVSVPMALWDDTFAKIQAMPYSTGRTGVRAARATGGLAVDSVGGAGWRGKTIYDPEQGDTLRTSWIATYATIVPDGREEHKWALVRSRANPGRGSQPTSENTLPEAYKTFAQSITTPLMENGVGDITFEYQATNAPVAFVVEMIDEDSGAIVDDETFRSVVKTAAVATAATRLYVPALRSGIAGRLRIRTLGPDDGGPDTESGTLLIDNLRATDYPNTGDTSWEAYNALVSTLTTTDDEYDPSMWPGVKKTDAKFDLQNMGYRSAVLNKTKDDYTPPPDGKWPDHVPYVQTPAIETGVGEISFWYRRAPDETEPGCLSLWVAKSQGTPDEDWVRLTPDNLNTNVEYNISTGTWEYQNDNLEAERLAMAAITNITTSEWTYFSAEFFQQDFNVLRIYAGTNFATFKTDAAGTGNGRMMLDNVLITEPVRASIDVGAIEFDPDVPLTAGPTGSKVTLTNPRMGPEVTKVELDWYVQNGAAVPLEITNRFIHVSEVARSTNAIVHIEGVGDIEVFPEWTEVHTNDMQTIEATKVPVALESHWGYASWANARTNFLADGTPLRGTLGFTNVTGSYVYLATNAIPTDRFPDDAVVQYCVRVEYNGRFADPVVSEFQGRMQNAFWFDNPAWYEPIDLNKAFGTTNRPAAHFWNFAVGTNVLLNEIRTSNANAANKAKEFVELIGPIGMPTNAPKPQLAGWTLAHAALTTTGYPILGQDALTNRLSDSAAFHAANNATTNKGWGVYVIGNEDVPGADERLLPDDTDFFLYYRGAMVLRRSMGAYAQRVVWTSGSERDVQDFIDMGYEYLGAMAGSASRLPTYALVPDPFAEEDEVPGLVWSTAYYTDRAITPGGFNFGQEDVLPDLLTEQEEIIPPLVSQPVITAYELVDPADAEAVLGTAVPDTWTRAALITFSVQTTNDVALAKGDWNWYVQTTDELPFPEKGAYGYQLGDLIGTVEVPSDKDVAGDAGDEILVTFAVSVDEDTRDVLFYRVYAVPKGE